MTKPLTLRVLFPMLVAVAVAAVVIALVFPALARGQERRSMAACAETARRLSACVLLYAQDYDQHLPPGASVDPEKGVQMWPQRVAAYAQGELRSRCPKDRKAQFTSYGLNRLLIGNPRNRTDTRGVPLSSVRRLAETLLMAETGTQSDLRTERADAYRVVPQNIRLTDEADARPAARHYARAQVSFADGHLKSLPLAAFYTRQTPPDRWFRP